MKRKLIIVRHAKSSWEDFRLMDVERPLNKRGITDAPIMAARLNELGVRPDLLITSHAVRAHETAKFFAKEFGIEDVEIMIDKSLYHGDIEEFINTTLLVNDDVKTVVLFGHNPGITYFANVVCGADIENVPTCGILVIESNAPSWAETDISKLDFIDFIYPKENA